MPHTVNPEITHQRMTEDSALALQEALYLRLPSLPTAEGFGEVNHKPSGAGAFMRVINAVTLKELLQENKVLLHLFEKKKRLKKSSS